MAGIVLNQGLQPFDIYFEDADEHVTIYFNPSDSDLPRRLMEAQKMIEEKVKDLEPYQTDGDGLPDADSCVAYLDKTKQIICDTLDYAFGNPVGATIFAKCGPFSIVNGNYQLLNFLQAITPEITKIVKKDQKTASGRANEYYKKYGKKAGK